MEHICNLSTQQTEADGLLQIQGYPSPHSEKPVPHSEFLASQDYVLRF